MQFICQKVILLSRSVLAPLCQKQGYIRDNKVCATKKADKKHGVEEISMLNNFESEASPERMEKLFVVVF